MTTLRSPRRGKDAFRLSQILWLLTVVSCGAPPIDPHYPPRPEGCDVKVFHGKVVGIVYDDIGRVDSICSNDLGLEQCIIELKKQACKLGGDIVYEVPVSPSSPRPTRCA
jgi:hypothetical protein